VIVAPREAESPGERERNIMRKILSMLIVGVVMGACDFGTTQPRLEEFEWFGTLEGEAGWEHLSGQAAFLWVQGATGFVAAAEIFGDEPGAIRPWHVHHNTCAAGGGIVGQDVVYPRLVVGAEGSAGAFASVPVAVDPNASFHVNIHLSEAEMETIIACGDLALIGSG
jgi:superoxide dismutase, Cu-Zn family